MATKLVMENARIGFRNFRGEASKFNPPGSRNFCVFLDSETADRLIRDGWNVRHLTPKDPEDEAQAYMQVAVRYEPKVPNIILITKHGKQRLDEESVSSLDWAEIESVDLIINPSNWEVQGKKGVKAYCQSLYVKIVQDEFADKYHELPEHNG
jgi:hypothetical protein